MATCRVISELVNGGTRQDKSDGSTIRPMSQFTSWRRRCSTSGATKRMSGTAHRFITSSNQVFGFRAMRKLSCTPTRGFEGSTLVSRLLADAMRRGARLLAGSAVSEISLEGHRVAEIILKDGTRVGVDAVVNAAGPGSGEVAGMVGRSLVLIDEPGLVARVRWDRVPVSRAMHTPHVQIRPDGDGRVLLHSRDVDAQIGQADTGKLAADVHALAIEVVPALATARPIDGRVAWRPIPFDRLPSVGAAKDIDGYYEAVTHGGITLCVIVGRLLADEIVGGGIDPLIQPFPPDRGAKTISMEETR
jgi:glycine/D-amino acid oxidase-like deaminating enzyme